MTGGSSEELERLRRERDRLARRLDELERSEAFRIGHLLVRLVKVPLALVRGRRRGSERKSVEITAPEKELAPGGSQRPAPDAKKSGRERQRRRASRAPGSLIGVDIRPGTMLVDLLGIPTERLTETLALLEDWATTEEQHLVLLSDRRDLDVPPGAPFTVQTLDGEDAETRRTHLAARFGAARVIHLIALGDGRPMAAMSRPVVVSHGSDAGLAGSDDIVPGPIFIGGTGRSGTWVVGRLLKNHPMVTTVHTELRFHASGGGFARLLDGEVAPDDFAREILDRWFRIAGPTGKAKGLQLVVGSAELRRALATFRRAAATDVPRALQGLMDDIMDPYARGRGASTWVETTPDNAAAAAALTTVFPDGRVIHMVRDGRDTAASVASMGWGPDTIEEGLEWWARRVRLANRGMANADPRRAMTVRLEELIHVDRDGTFERLIGFLQIQDDEPLRSYFDSEMDAARGHVGRWRGQVSDRQRDRIDQRYRELYAELEEEGLSGLPISPDVADSLSSPTK
jgi:hypothetical protein